ncbi:hypothetical protein [Geodermatophilus ruber]|uniref:hypothetical protein n=1 Tax=Geodermatophilus ruber TaxID=504800 RepID=UPI0015A59142|nr:hypothetical protein [Geodermatophilus ruber]
MLAAERADLPEDVAGQLALSTDTDVLVALVTNPAVDPLVVGGVIAWCDPTGVIRTAYEHHCAVAQQDTTEEDDGLADNAARTTAGGVGGGVGGQPGRDRLSVEETRRCAVELDWRPDQLEHVVSPDGVAALLHRTDDPELLIATFHRARDEFRAVAAANPCLPVDLVVRAAEDPSWEVRLAALSNPELPADLVEVALAEAVELTGRNPASAEADGIRRAVASNSSAPADVLVALAGAELAAAAFTLLAHHPETAWGGLTLDELIDIAWGEPDDPPLPAVPVADLRWPGRLALVTQDRYDPDRLLGEADADAADGGDFATVAWALLDLEERHSGEWPLSSPMRQVATSIAEDERCDRDLANRLLRDHDRCAATMLALATNPSIDVDRALGAMYAWTNRDHVVGNVLEAERARSLGKAMLATGRGPEDLARIAAHLESGGDVVRQLGYDRADTLVHTAVQTVVPLPRAAGQATST